MIYDAIVIGAGYAGLTAALRLAQAGQKTLLLAKGHSGTHLKPGVIDVLGYDDGQRVQRPLEAVARLRAVKPTHPYALLSESDVRDAIQFFQGAMAEAGYPFEGSVEENLLLPTALGVARPTALVPRTMLTGQVQQGRSYLILGFTNFKDFYPDLIADNLPRSFAGIQVRSKLIIAPGLESEADLPPMLLAHAFERAEFREKLANMLKANLHPGERVGFPAVLGLDDPLTVLSDLEARLETAVFEIPTLPPSIPGLRVFHAFERLLRKYGARVQIGHPVIEPHTTGNRIESVAVQSAVRPVVYSAREFLLATGGLLSGGLAVDSYGQISERLFNLPLAGAPGPGDARFQARYFEEHPINSIGITVDAEMRPLDEHGQVVYSNLRACGALVARTDVWKEKSSGGISLGTAYRAAQAILANVQITAGAGGAQTRRLS